MDPNAGLRIRRQTMEILIDSNSPKFKNLSETLLSDPDMKFGEPVDCQSLKRKKLVNSWFQTLSEFEGTEQDEVVEILCGRINWANLLSGENRKEAKSKS